MSVPDPISPACESNKHNVCDGSEHSAWNHLTDEPARCCCSCHPKVRSR
jgi:hypothetical protein